MENFRYGFYYKYIFPFRVGSDDLRDWGNFNIM